MAEKKTILVTGASGGIGSAIAERFLNEGHRVALHANRNYDAVVRAAELAKERGQSAFPVSCDLTDADAIGNMIEKVEKEFGSVEVLINNAGIALTQKLITDCTEADWDKLFAVDVKGVFLITKRVLPRMISNQEGSIVNLASIWGVTGGSCEVPYTAAKAAVIGFTKALAAEVGPSGVRVNCVAPGLIDTKMNAHLSDADRASFAESTPLCRMGSPKEIASAVHFFALSDASFITGQVLSVDGGFTI